MNRVCCAVVSLKQTDDIDWDRQRNVKIKPHWFVCTLVCVNERVFVCQSGMRMEAKSLERKRKTIQMNQLQCTVSLVFRNQIRRTWLIVPLVRAQRLNAHTHTNELVRSSALCCSVFLSASRKQILKKMYSQICVRQTQ